MTTDNVIELKERLSIVVNRIVKIDGTKDYTDRVASSFHLGMVGGSGRNTASLNRKRERCLNRTIERAVIACKLYKEMDELSRRIKYIESGKKDADIQAKERGYILLAKYFKELKAGDYIDIGANSKTLITKKNNKSLETGSDCKWTATEIIGKQAASLL